MPEHLSTSHPSDTTSAPGAPLGRYYEVEGRRLLLHRSGTGSPAVVILPGAGTVGLDYLSVQERAASACDGQGRGLLTGVTSR